MNESSWMKWNVATSVYENEKKQVLNSRHNKATYWIFPEVHLSDILAALFQVAFKDEDLEALAFTLEKYWAKNRPSLNVMLFCVNWGNILHKSRLDSPRVFFLVRTEIEGSSKDMPINIFNVYTMLIIYKWLKSVYHR